MPTKKEIQKFSMMIAELASDKKIGVMEAICHYCEQNQFEIEVASSLISPPLKAKLRLEAENLNLLKKKNRLPI